MSTKSGLLMLSDADGDAVKAMGLVGPPHGPAPNPTPSPHVPSLALALALPLRRTTCPYPCP